MEKRKVIVIGAARGTSAKINDKEYYFLYDGEALFRIQEEFGPEILPEMTLKDMDGIRNILRVSEILTEQAAKQCKQHGIDAPVFSRDEFLMPYGYLALQKACLDAANIGFEREIQDDDEEIDLILLKQQKKRGTEGQSTSKTD